MENIKEAIVLVLETIESEDLEQPAPESPKIIADEIPHLVIPDAVPVGSFFGGVFQVVNAESIWLAFDQPVIHSDSFAGK